MKKIKLLAILATMAMTVGLTAVPASASTDPALVLFSGTALVCAPNNSGNPTGTPAGSCPAGQSGLYIPEGEDAIQGSDKPRQRVGTWSFGSTGFFGGGVAPDCFAVAPLKPFQGECGIGLIEGDLGPVLGIGAACGLSHGWDGGGPARLGSAMAPVQTLALTNVMWVTSAGGLLPFVGHYAVTGGSDPKKNGPGGSGKSVGPLAGAVLAFGGSPCIKNPVDGDGGASEFNVIGFAHLF